MKTNRALSKVSILVALCWMPLAALSQSTFPNMEATYGFNYSGGARHSGGAPSFTLPGSIAYSPFDWWTIKVEANTLKAIPRTSLPWVEGVGDSFLGTTLQTQETKDKPALSVNYRVKLPTADEQQKLGSGKYDHKVVFGAAKRFNDSWTVKSGAGDVITGLAKGGYYHRAIVSASLEHQFAPKGVKFATELDYQPSKVNAQVQKPTDVFVVSTLTFPVSLKSVPPDALTFRGTATAGLTPYTPASGVSGSLIYKLEFKKR